MSFYKNHFLISTVLLTWLGAGIASQKYADAIFSIGYALPSALILAMVFTYSLKRILEHHKIEKYNIFKILLLTVFVFCVEAMDTSNMRATIVNCIASLIFSLPYSIYLIRYMKKRQS